MRIPRLVIIVGPAAVLYVLAARASSQVAESAGLFVALSALAIAVLPLALRGARVDRRVSAVAVMATAIAVALASARSSDVWLDRLHDVSWLVVVSLVLGLALPTTMARWLRLLVVVGFAASAGLAALASNAGLVPPQTLGVVVVAGLLAAGALHQVMLTARGHAVEGGLTAIAIVTLGVGLAYAWFGPLTGALASVVETMVGAMLWFAHLAWVDARWRGLRRTGVPFLVASTFVFIVGYLWSPGRSLDPWERGVAVVVAAVLWWLVFAVTQRVSRRTVWSTSEKLAAAAARARRALYSASDLEAVALAVLGPLGALAADPEERCEVVALEPPLRIRLASGARVEIRTGDAPEPLMRALGVDSSPHVLDLLSLRERIVREPDLRPLVGLMELRGMGAVVPCVSTDHLEGLLVLPLARRSEPLSSVESDALLRLGRALGTRLSSTLAERRAQSHIHEVSELHRSAQARVAELETEVQQLRGQCDVLGRGFAEDPSLHVAYSPSMRRVQTRAVELAASDRPVMLCGASGSPLLQVSRFIHDRGPQRDAPFIVIDCATTSPEEASSWLDSALGGTLVLRDLPALPVEIQSRLANAIESESHATLPGPRIMATVRTTRAEHESPLGVDPDLARVLGANALMVPALRERREDVPSLVLLAVDRGCRVLARDPVGIDQTAMEALVDHEWPGDVAELELVVQLAVARVQGRTIGVSDLPPLAWAPAPLEEALDGTYVEVERRLLEQALRVAGGNKSEAARRLGLKRTTFLDKLRRHGLETPLSGDVGGSAVG